MKIGFDISQTCQSKSGTGFVADQLIRALAEIDKENEYTLFPHFYDYRPQDIKPATCIEQKNFKNKLITNFSDESKEIAELDIIHSNNFRFPKDTRAKKVVVIHDVSFLDHPEYTTDANRLVCYQGTLDSMLFADKIIAVSAYTKERLMHFFPFVDANKIEVVYNGNRDTLLKEKDDINLITKFGLKKEDYFLSVGTIEPRKNYGTLLKAYKIYKEKTVNYKKLCIAGGYGWMQENFKEDIAALGLTDDVVVTGYVEDAELANLYRYCFAFTYPTWYEGFGLPVLEALNFNKFVIASDITSIPEVAGDAAILTVPGDVDALAKAMSRLENDAELRAELMAKIPEQLKKFSWEKSAKQLLALYRELSL